MSNLYIFISFFLSFPRFFLFNSFASSSSFNATHKCSPQQALDLLLFKESMSSVNYSDFKGDYLDTDCQHRLGSRYHPIMMEWNINTDCCTWDGVTCNHLTGDVIGINLSCGMLRGTFPPNTTLFHLPHLQTLNLAFNDFSYSQVPREIGRLSNSLTHLNLSQCWFIGEIPVEILFLPELVSLDLSWNYQIQIQPSFWKNLMQNSTHLRELLLNDVDMGWVLPAYINISSSLKSLNLNRTGLQGKLPDNIFSLPYLEVLDLSYNHELTGLFPKVNRSINVPLKWLDLSYTSLSGDMSDSVGHFKSLDYLGLSSCGLVGSLPNSLVNLRHLTTLDLSNNKLNGTLPSFLFTLPLIEHIDLSANMFTGGLPSEVFNCTSVKELSLGINQFDGEINAGSTPPSFLQLPNLHTLYLSYSGLMVVNNNGTNHVHSGLQELYLESCQLTVFPESLRAMKNLQLLDLSNNNIQGRIPDWAGEIGGNGLLFLDLSNNSITGLSQFQWDGIEYLYLQSNKIQGSLPTSICNMRNLASLDLSDNSFSGVIPQCLAHTGSSLEYLNVNSNQIQGPFPISICNMTSLRILDMSNNSFSGLIPKCLENIFSLENLNVNSNHIQGPFPSSVCNMRNLDTLDISNNSFSGVVPQCLGNIGSSLSYLDVKSNQLQGPFPSSICNMSLLSYLDMSNNRFVGKIPQCFGNIIPSLVMVDMGNNQFHGIIPDVYKECGNLEGLILNGNRLQGKVPSSLSKCQYLKVLDIGNNNLNGTFPGWLADLQYLQVLILKSNNFHGLIETSSLHKSAFPSMLVLDLSHNGFVGHLAGKYFQYFNSMKNMVKSNTIPEYLSVGKYYSTTIAVKGRDQVFLRLIVGYTIVDLSSNRFEGEIPGIIGFLTSLKVLNLSHNILTGHIPNAFGKLSEIESLDLSWNQLTGEIPGSLADLTFLGFLNLSQNHLVGRIPAGTQFSTLANSFGGNTELCGLPLPKECDLPHERQPEVDRDGDGDEESIFTWRVVMLGFGCGTLNGLVIGYVMLSTGRPKWFNEIADAGEQMIQTRGNKRRHVYIGKELGASRVKLELFDYAAVELYVSAGNMMPT